MAPNQARRQTIMVPGRSPSDAAPPGGSKALAKTKSSRKSMISSSTEHKKEDDSIKVYVRCRPLRPNESETTWSHTKTTISENSESNTSFSFDQVYPNATQTEQIFSEHLQKLADAVLSGFNSSFFCYGQTGSGKTHTMLGDKSEPGTLPRLAKLLCEKCAASETHRYLMRVSYFEIYNDEISDLLSNSSEKLKITDHSTKGPICVGAVERFVTSEDNCVAIVDEGQQGRRVASTLMNEQSSRSHTIFRITVESRQINEGEQAGLVQLSEVCQEVQKSKQAALTVSMLNLIDLAGSERVAKTGAVGDTLKEGTMINKSLTTLSKVINELSKGSAAGHVPYRDSKLTRMLQQALGGNSRCATVCCISTADVHKEETLSTLRFAARCKLIENKAVKNVVAASSKMLQIYKQEIEALKAKLESQSMTSMFPPEVGETGEPARREKEAKEAKENVRLRLKMASMKKRADDPVFDPGSSDKAVNQMKVLLNWQKGINATMHRKSKERQEILELEVERVNALSVTMSTELKLERAKSQLLVQDLSDQIQLLKLELEESGGAGTKELQAENKRLKEAAKMAKVNAMWKRAHTMTMIKNLTDSNALLEEENVRQAAITASLQQQLLDNEENLIKQVNELENLKSMARDLSRDRSTTETTQLLNQIADMEQTQKNNLDNACIANWQKWRAAEAKLREANVQNNILEAQVEELRDELDLAKVEAARSAGKSTSAPSHAVDMLPIGTKDSVEVESLRASLHAAQTEIDNLKLQMVVQPPAQHDHAQSAISTHLGRRLTSDLANKMGASRMEANNLQKPRRARSAGGLFSCFSDGRNDMIEEDLDMDAPQNAPQDRVVQQSSPLFGNSEEPFKPGTAQAAAASGSRKVVRMSMVQNRRYSNEPMIGAD